VWAVPTTVGGRGGGEGGGRSVERRLEEAAVHWARLGGERLVGGEDIRRVVPVGEALWEVRDTKRFKRGLQLLNGELQSSLKSLP
jgi:hypothetical protein